GERLNPTAELSGFVVFLGFRELDELDLFAGHDGAKTDKGTIGAKQERLVDEIVVARQHGDRSWHGTNRRDGIHVASGVKGGLLDRSNAVDAAELSEGWLIEVHPAQRRLQL